MTRCLTVDVGVLMSGSGLGVPRDESASRGLMEAMRTASGVRLVVDDRGQITLQYRRKMVAGTLGHEWVRQMASMGKVVAVHWQSVDRGTYKRLEDCHFDWEDFKYVRTAEASASKKLVSHDPGYSSRVQKVLKRRLSVVVWIASQAQSWIEATH